MTMPPLLHDEPPGPTVVVRPSIPVEIEWALAAAERVEYRSASPALAALYDNTPGLAERVSTFWGKGAGMTCGGHLELLVLAHHGGLLFVDDATILLARLGDLCAAAPTSLPLESEGHDDRAVVLDRLARLRTSPALRRRYVDLITEVWAGLRDGWERDGRPAVEAAVAARRDLVAKGVPWPEVAGKGCDFDGLLARLVDRLGPGDQFAIVPAYFTHRGLLADLPGLVVLGVRTDHYGAGERARTVVLARRLKALADPTRLAILSSLADQPRTITEIAAIFSLAQPTVSNHVKLLDEGGLVARAKSGSRRELLVARDTVEEILDELRLVLDPHGAAGASRAGRAAFPASSQQSLRQP